MRFFSVLLKAAKAFLKALVFPWFVVKVCPLCTRCSMNAVEAEKPDRDLTVQIRIMLEVSEEFFPFCLPRLLRKLAHFGGFQCGVPLPSLGGCFVA